MFVALVACGGGKADPFLDVGTKSGSDDRAAKDSGSGSGTAEKKETKETKPDSGEVTTEWIPTHDAISKSSPIDGDATLTVIERAFRNQRPAFPLISKDGETVVVDLKTRSNEKGWLTYTVEYIGVNATTAAERIPLVDAPLMTLVGTARDASAIPMSEVKRITKAAKRINDRTHEDGFARFEGSIDKVTGKDVTAGPFRITRVGDGDLVLRVSQGRFEADTPKLEATPMPKVGASDCVAQPKLQRVFFDGPRKRVLIHVGWETGPDQCSLPDDRYFFIGPPS